MGEAGGEQKYFMYFSRRTSRSTFMTYKYLAKDDDRWLFIPAINMVKHIAAQDKRSSFVGSDSPTGCRPRHRGDDGHAIERLGRKRPGTDWLRGQEHA
ncbi:MAG: outer membrane lipoprotein-sorting protein [Rhodocyclaceae bacterium]|nr:outer membrane lipoprotein-sorting protein [Rhodocyclaceae bacterium]